MSTVLLYNKLDEPKAAYMVKSGNVKCKITDEDEFIIPCHQVIIGGGEILVGEEQHFTESRHLTIHYVSEKENSSKNIIKLNPKQIINGVDTYKVAFHTARFIAMCLQKINEIRTEKNNSLNHRDELLKRYSIIYAEAIEKLKLEFEQKGFPWIEKLIESADQLVYQKGKSFVSLRNRKRVELDSEKLDKYNIKYPKGSYVCKQGDKGTQLYKLVKGKLKVLVNKNPVTEIEEGTVVGEMALLLGETRTATLQAMEDSIVTVISKEQLTEVLKEDKNFFKNIIISLSRWELISTNLVEQINDLIKDSNENSSDEKAHMHKLIDYKTKIKDLRKTISELYNKYEQPFLFEISSQITEELRNTESWTNSLK